MNHRLPLTRRLRYCRAEMTFERDLRPGEATLARGFFGREFRDEPLVHQHLSTGTIYRYPKVQFKVIGGKLFLVGLEEGCDVVEKLAKVETLELAQEKFIVTRLSIEDEEAVIGMSEGMIEYGFVTPWLALNEDNHRRFSRAGNDQHSNKFSSEQMRLLRSALIGNFLSFAKGLDFTVPEEIRVRGLEAFPVDCSLKGTPMIGFLGGFSASFHLPDLIGLGKSVSRGFGCVQGAEPLT